MSDFHFLSRIQPGDLRDEDGVALGGKKASIQFAHNIRKKAEDGLNGNPETEVVLDDVVRFHCVSTWDSFSEVIIIIIIAI